MKEYTSKDAAFHEKINIVDTTDPDNADLISMADKQNFENTLFLKHKLDQLCFATEDDVEQIAQELMGTIGLPGGTEEEVRTATDDEIDDILAGLDEILN